MSSPVGVSTYDHKGVAYTRREDYDEGGPYRVVYMQWFSPEFADFPTLKEAQSWCAWAIDWDDDHFFGHAAPEAIINLTTDKEEKMWR